MQGRIHLTPLEKVSRKPIVSQEHNAIILKVNQLLLRENSAKIKVRADVRRVNPKNLYQSFPQTMQRTIYLKCFLPLPIPGLETYHGVPQPEPPSFIFLKQ